MKCQFMGSFGHQCQRALDQGGWAVVLAALTLAGDAAAAQSALNLRALRSHCDFDGDGGCDYSYWRVSDGNWIIKKSSNGLALLQQWGVAEDIPVPQDYDGDGRTDFAVWRPSSGAWAIIYSSNGAVQNPQWGAAEDIPVPADYDGDGKADVATFRPSSGQWAIVQSSTGSMLSPAPQWGAAEDIPIPADYDGDGKADIATFRPSSGQWAIVQSSTGGALSPAPQWGAEEDMPVPADYDADGKADIATYRPSSGQWAIFQSSNGSTHTALWGAPEDFPVPGDWDKDHKTDIAVWRPSTGRFVIKKSSGGTTDLAWGAPGNVPVMRRRYRPKPPGDFDGDGKSDLGIYRPSSRRWALQESAAGAVPAVTYGTANDIPVSADYDGDGKADLATFRPHDGMFRFSGTAVGAVSTQLGWVEDVPVSADYDGDRKADEAVYRFTDGTFYFIPSSTNAFASQPLAQGTPVPADYDGDGKADVAVYLMLTATTAEWRIKHATGVDRVVSVPSALAEDVPVPADYDGDGRADIASWRPSTGNWTRTLSSTAATVVKQWGIAEDVPAPGDFDGDGKADVAIWRPSTGNWSIIPSSTGVAWANKQWGAPEDIPLVRTAPNRPWWYSPATLTSLSGLTTVVGDTPVVSTPYGGRFWEFSALAAPPGTTGCANGRRFLAGAAGGGYNDPKLLFKAAMNCSGTGCISTNDHGLLTGWGSGAGGAVVAGDRFASPDNNMTRLPNGDLLLARDVEHALPLKVSTEQIFRSTDCGNTWTALSNIDPTAKVGSAPRYAPSVYPDEPNASFGNPQDAEGAPGGWDREEIYADPFTTSVYVTASGKGGYAGGPFPGAADTLLLRSSDSGQTWQSTVYDAHVITPPIMASAVPGRVYFFGCFGSAPVLRWTNDGGATLARRAPIASGYHCTSSAETSGKSESFVTVSRVSWATNGDATLRVTFPDVKANGDQVVRLFSVKITNGVVTSRYIRSFERSGYHIISTVAIEPDVSVAPLTNDNATLYFWKEQLRSDGSIRVRGVVMEDETASTSIFDVSTVTATGGGGRSWLQTVDRTGDYAKGGFSYNGANTRYEYFVPWIETNASGVHEMHTKVFALPR